MPENRLARAGGYILEHVCAVHKLSVSAVLLKLYFVELENNNK